MVVVVGSAGVAGGQRHEPVPASGRLLGERHHLAQRQAGALGDRAPRRRARPSRDRPTPSRAAGNPATSTCSAVRAAGQRSSVVPRTPSEPVSRRSTSAICAASAVSQSAVTVYAGRPFFITIGVIHASWAPASISAPIVCASVSPVASSTFDLEQHHGLARRPASRARSPTTTCTTLGRPSMLAGAGTEPDRPDRHRRHRPPADDVGRQQRRAGRRRELERHVDAVGRRAAQQLDDRGRGDRAARRARRASCPCRWRPATA